VILPGLEGQTLPGSISLDSGVVVVVILAGLGDRTLPPPWLTIAPPPM
jgi:hypothetical protein